MFMVCHVHGMVCSWCGMFMVCHVMSISWDGMFVARLCSWHGCVRGMVVFVVWHVMARSWCVCMWSGRTFEGTDESDNVTMLDAAHDVDLELGLLDLSR